MLSHFHIDSRLETLPFPSTPPSDIPHAARDEPRLSLVHWFVTVRSVPRTLLLWGFYSIKTPFTKICLQA